MLDFRGMCGSFFQMLSSVTDACPTCSGTVGDLILPISHAETTPYGCSGACQFDLEAQHTAVVLKSPSPCLSWPSEYLAQPALFVYLRVSCLHWKRPENVHTPTLSLELPP